MKLERRRQRWKLQEKLYSKSSRTRKREEELKKSMLRTSETSFTYKNSKNRLDRRKERRMRREKGSSKNSLLHRNIKRDLRRRDRLRRREWRMSSSRNSCKSLLRMKDLSK
jgi:hypothetical protein